MGASEQKGVRDGWTASDAYERFMGRWSRRCADSFVQWLAPAEEQHWLEMGCGTGALSAAICRACNPASLLACDPSEAFVQQARRSVTNCAFEAVVAGSENLPRRDAGFDWAVSGLVLNFVPNAARTVEQLRLRLSPGGSVACYVWDYSDGMQFLRHFWDAAVALDAGAAALDEARRFPMCNRDELRRIFTAAGCTDVEVQAVDVQTTFESFDDYWSPFLGGAGPAPSYVASLAADARERLREYIRGALSAERDGSIRLRARAWAVRGS